MVDCNIIENSDSKKTAIKSHKEVPCSSHNKYDLDKQKSEISVLTQVCAKYKQRVQKTEDIKEDNLLWEDNTNEPEHESFGNDGNNFRIVAAEENFKSENNSVSSKGSNSVITQKQIKIKGDFKPINYSNYSALVTPHKLHPKVLKSNFKHKSKYQKGVNKQKYININDYLDLLDLKDLKLLQKFEKKSKHANLNSKNNKACVDVNSFKVELHSEKEYFLKDKNITKNQSNPRKSKISTILHLNKERLKLENIVSVQITKRKNLILNISHKLLITTLHKIL